MVHPVAAAFLAGLGTWGATALGSSMVFLSGTWIKAKTMDFVYGASAGVMLAACFFSLLGPSVALAKELKWMPWIPATVGFVLGVLAIKIADWVLPEYSADHPLLKCCFGTPSASYEELEELERGAAAIRPNPATNGVGQRTNPVDPEAPPVAPVESPDSPVPLDAVVAETPLVAGSVSKNLILLVLAITLHNFPEGLAMGFAFGGTSNSGVHYSMAEAVLLAVALALQNIPEGMAISIPLHRSGVAKGKAFLLGQFSGSVEVLGAVLGSAFALLLSNFLPFFLSFAAGAMIYVVLSDLLPHSTQTRSRWGLYGCLVGFLVMMALDTGFS